MERLLRVYFLAMLAGGALIGLSFLTGIPSAFQPLLPILLVAGFFVVIVFAVAIIYRALSLLFGRDSA